MVNKKKKIYIYIYFFICILQTHHLTSHLAKQTVVVFNVYSVAVQIEMYIPITTPASLLSSTVKLSDYFYMCVYIYIYIYIFFFLINLSFSFINFLQIFIKPVLAFSKRSFSNRSLFYQRETLIKNRSVFINKHTKGYIGISFLQN